jgi:ankyrin repeat protein
MTTFKKDLQSLLQEFRNLKFKRNIASKSLSIKTLLKKEYRFRRIFTFFQLIKYKHFLSLNEFINKYNKNEEIYYDLNEPLVLASQISNLEIIRLFIETGADVNASSKEGKTVPGEASEQGNLKIVNFLL